MLQTKYGSVPLNLIGRHNMQNIMGALLICRDLGVEDHQFYNAMQLSTGAKTGNNCWPMETAGPYTWTMPMLPPAWRQQSMHLKKLTVTRNW